MGQAQHSRARAATVEQSVDVVARAALRASDTDEASMTALGGALEDLEVRCTEWLGSVQDCVRTARADAARKDLGAVLSRVAELTELLVRGVAPGVSPEPIEAAASGSSPLVDDDFIDFSAGSTAHDGIAGEDDVAQVDLRSLPTFLNEAHDHLHRADLDLLALESSPTDEEALGALFRCMHTLKGSSAIVGLAPVKELAHEAEQVLELARARKLRLEGEAINTLFDAVDDLRRLVDEAAAEATAGGPLRVRPDERLLGTLRCIARSTEEGASLRIGEILTAMGATTPETVAEATERQAAATDGRTPLGTMLVREHGVDEASLQKALRLQDAVRRQAAEAGADQPRAVRSADVVRVDAERLDKFVDAIGELVIAESMVAHSPDLRASPLFAKLARPVGQLDKIARTLQEMATSLRMVPVRDTFQRMHRTVRDVARRCGKSVSLVTSGESTELDKAVVDQLADPLMHLVRNAIDHGIEPRETRLAAGKPAEGRIELRAVHAGDEVHIEIEDDGRGLARDKILARALERGLVRDGDELTDSQVFALVFEPGFSTAEAVTDISGRGVGTDVVKKTVEALRGRVEVRSTPGHGAVFTLRLPLTMAVIDGMLVAVGAQRYILPTLSVVRTVQRSANEITELVGGGRTIELNGKWVPVRSLGELLDAPPAAATSDRQLVVVVENGGRRLGLVVDQLLGQQQIVIKNLGSAVDAPAVAGGAILPDGTVGLVLELADLLDLSTSTPCAAA